METDNGDVPMKILKTLQVSPKKYMVDALCNKCGESCRVSGTDEDPIFEGIVEYTVAGSYFSKTLEDMTQYTFSMCGGCLKQMFETFKHPVDRQEYSFG